MKKFAAVLFPIVALFAPGVHADGDSAPTGDGSWWYTPDGGFEAETAKGTVYYFDEATGMEKSSTITVDNDGNVSGSEVPFGNDYALKTAYEAMKAALQDAAVLKLHETAIETIGARLNSMYGQNMQLTIGIGGYKNTDSTISITPGKDGENAKFEIADNIPYMQMVDGRTLSDNGQGRFQLYSANAPADKKVDLLSNVADAGVYLPMLLDGYLRWGEWSGADTDVFEYKKRDGYKATRLELRGFKDDEYTMESSTLSKLLTSSDVDSWAKRGEVRIPVRWKVPGNAAGLYYLKIGDVLGGLGNPPDGVSIEDYVDGSSTNLAIKGWHAGTASSDVVLANIMLSKAPEGEQPAKEYTVLVRGHDNTLGSNDLYYAAIGDLYKMSWSTNWYDAVKDIVDEEQVVMGQHLTNLVYSAAGDPDTVYNRLVEITKRAENAGDRVNDTYTHLTNLTKSAAGEVDSLYAHITNLTASARDESEKAKSTYAHILALSESADSETDAIFDRITNVMHKAETAQAAADTSYAHLTNLITTAGNPEAVYHHITNLTYKTHYTFITNVVEYMQTFENWTYVTNYLVMYMGVEQKKGDGPVAPPPVDRKDDPYDSEYEHDRVKDSLLPVKTALIVNKATNDLWGVVNAEHALDNMSLYTNEAHRAEIQGYKAATTNKMPVKVKLEHPKTDRDGNPILYGIEWMDYPSVLMAITSKNIDKIEKWLKVMQTENIFTLVASNTEKVAMLQTAPYNVINANTLLDNASIWTNDNLLAEVKGFQHADYYSYPVKVMGSNGDEVEWTPIDQPDSVVAFDYGDGERLVYNRSLSRMIDYGVSSISNVWSLYGFNESGAGTVPRIGHDELGNKELEWTAEAKPDSAVPFDYAPGNITLDSIERTDDFGVGSASNVWSVYGFRYAAEGTTPHVHTDEFGNKKLKWGLTGNAVRVVGTDGSEAVVGVAAQTNTLTFASAADSNVRATVVGDGAGNVTVTFGVYYLNNASVQPPNVE